jgi:hypothetical protein
MLFDIVWRCTNPLAEETTDGKAQSANGNNFSVGVIDKAPLTASS